VANGGGRRARVATPFGVITATCLSWDGEVRHPGTMPVDPGAIPETRMVPNAGNEANHSDLDRTGCGMPVARRWPADDERLGDLAEGGDRIRASRHRKKKRQLRRSINFMERKPEKP
jgi:hypothetical protein